MAKTSKETYETIAEHAARLACKNYSIMLRNFSTIKSYYGIKPGLLNDHVNKCLGLSFNETIVRGYCYRNFSEKNCSNFARYTGNLVMQLVSECLGVKFWKLMSDEFNVYEDVNEGIGSFFLEYPIYKKKPKAA